MTVLLFHVYFHRGGSCKHLPLYTFLLLFPTDCSLLVSSQRWHSSLFESLPILLFQILLICTSCRLVTMVFNF